MELVEGQKGENKDLDLGSSKGESDSSNFFNGVADLYCSNKDSNLLGLKKINKSKNIPPAPPPPWRSVGWRRL